MASVSNLIGLANAAVSAAQAYVNSLGTNQSSPQYLTAQRYLSYVTLIVKNLQRGQSPRTLVKQGGDLCMVAATYYGDASLGFPLAAANGLITPNLSDTVVYQISLPPASSLTG